MNVNLKILLFHIMTMKTHRPTHIFTFCSADQREVFRLVFGMHLVRISVFMTEDFVVSVRQMAH